MANHYIYINYMCVYIYIYIRTRKILQTASGATTAHTFLSFLDSSGDLVNIHGNTVRWAVGVCAFLHAVQWALHSLGPKPSIHTLTPATELMHV